MNNIDLCTSFKKNQDGSWTSIKAVEIQGPSGSIKIGPGMTFNRGVSFMGLDLAKLLDEACR